MFRNRRNTVKNINLVLVLALLFTLLPPLPVHAQSESEAAQPALTVATDTLSLCYDDHLDMTGKTVEIIDAGLSVSDHPDIAQGSVITLKGDYLVATGIGSAQVRIDGIPHQITVRKAKIQLVVIMGQSNAGNHFANATSDVTCPIGTAYWWGNGQGTAATEPVAYTQPSMGFHTPLLAELYAQSAAAGDPVKNVMIWQEGITSKNGKSITHWASSATNTSGTDAAVTMIENCRAYYAQHSDKYEIVGSGVYWLQGESDLTMDPALYTQRFMAMWQRLKHAGMDYLAFFRVRRATTNQPADHDDLNYSASLSAQIQMINDNPDFYMATDLTESWVGTEAVRHTVDISKYITVTEAYGGNATYADSYGNIAAYADGKLTTTMKCLYGSNNKCHYGKFGYGLIAADAAYHMYRALHGDTVTIIQTDTSGHADRKLLLTDGQEVTIDVTDMTDNLSFRAACGSVGGTLSVTVRSGQTDITSQTAVSSGELHGSVSTEKLRQYEDVSITAVYTTQAGVAHTITCRILDKTVAPLSLRYDDHYDVTGKTLEILDAGVPTSYQVGYGVDENSVLDTAVVTLEGNTLVATGIGSAKVKIDGEIHNVTVEAAPISLLLLIGQSNMRGSEGNANQSIVCPDGMVYSTYGDDRGESNTAMTVSNAPQFAPSALTGAYNSINVAGTTDCLSGYPVNSLTEAGAGKIGPDSGFAYEWVKQTGEKVWVVNAAHGGTSINVWQPGTTEYEQCQALFTACQETLRKEIAAGHFTLSHMAYFWCQGCSDRTQSAQWYVNKYLAMHNGLKAEMSFDHDSNVDTADKAFEFGGIIPVRVGSTATCYRDGVYSVSNPYAYHESFVDLRFSGPRAAQYWMINNPELSDIWGVCDIGDNWVWMPDGTNGVSAYFQAHYPNGTVDYTTQVAQKASWYTPTTPKAVHDSIHYNQIGYNEYGREAVRNALILLGELEAPNVETTVELLSWDGYTPVEQVTASTAGNSGTLVVPKVYPIWKSKDVAYELSEGLNWNYCDLLAADAQTEGTLTVGGQTVSVAKAAPGVHYVEHLSQLPADICCGLNLWPLLEHDSEFYYGGTHWAPHGTKDVCSVTIPVNPGERIFATAFGKAGQNGHDTSNGIRVTFFSAYGVAKTTDPAGTYQEFVTNGGYLVVPEGATAANIPMWTNDNSNELYILNRTHDTTEGICGICGKNSHIHSWSDWITITEPNKDGPGTEKRTCACGDEETRDVEGVWQTLKLSDHMSPMPESYCSGTNLWTAMEHDPYYFANGTNWSIYSGGTVKSVTISVEPGDKIFATAWGKAGENGHATSNGIRVSFFDAYGVAKTMSPAECYAEFSKNGGYLIAPKGAIAVNVAMWNNSNSNEIYILNRNHIYKNGICTGCRGEHPNLANYEGKVISILSASTSTFAGWIPVADGFNLEHRARYPQDNLFTDVESTWWHQLITQLDAKLGINDSWAGSQVLNTQDTNSGDLGPDAAMASLTRIQNLGANGDPDLILFFGAGNDMGRGVALGSFDPATAPSSVDLTATKWDTLADAYVAAIMRLQHFYPDAEIVVMTTYAMPSYVTKAKLDKYTPVLKAICDHYGVKTVDLRNSGVTFDMLPDKIHPNAEGMDYITEYVLQSLLNDVTMEAGERTVYTVTHELANVTASLGYYKGISAGKSFTETLTGDDLTVTVTMGSKDITASCYSNGRISIPAVTGDVKITAKAAFDADGHLQHLQQLPETVCAGTNLWTALDPENIYYTADGWGLFSNSPDVHSITFSVEPGERIWATSFGAYPNNGSTANGTRITWFNENGLLKTVDRSTVYKEFQEKGYLTVPKEATVLNIPCATGDSNFEVYLLDRTHNYVSEVVEPTCTEQGYTTYTCSTCGDSYTAAYVDARGYDWMLEDGEFKLLLIGNSFSEDASNCGMPNSQMLDILQAMLGENIKVTVGLCYSGGKGLNWHATQSEQGNRSYSLRVISTESGKWTSLGSYTSADALTWTDWDVVTLQHYEINTSTGEESNAYPDQVDQKFNTLETATEFMLDYVDRYAPNAALYFYMHWARAYKPNLNESLETYNRMAEFFPVVLDYAGTESANRFETIIPVGLSIQNARTTYLAKLAYNTTAYADKNLNLNTDAQIGLQRDGGHLSFNIGRYIAALTFAETIIPQQMRANGYVLPDIRFTESVGKLPKEYTVIAQKAVHAAVESWSKGSLSVTDIGGYTEDPTVAAATKLTGMFLQPNCTTADAIADQIRKAILAELPADFAVDSVAVDKETGIAVVVIRFGYTSKAVEIPCAVKPHAFERAVIAPTCTERGYTTYTCACGERYVDDYVDATGEHTYEHGTCTGCGRAQPGDLNGDGKLNNKDVTRLMQYLAGWDVEIH